MNMTKHKMMKKIVPMTPKREPVLPVTVLFIDNLSNMVRKLSPTNIFKTIYIQKYLIN